MKNPCAEIQLGSSKAIEPKFCSHAVSSLRMLNINTLDGTQMLPGGLVVQSAVWSSALGVRMDQERLGMIVGIDASTIHIAWGPWVPEREPHHEVVAALGRQAQSASMAIARLSQALQSAAKTLNMTFPQTTLKKVPDRGKNDKKRSKRRR